MVPQVQYTQSGTVNIAYQVFGQEKPNLVLVYGWLSNIEEAWKNPWMVNWQMQLASVARIVVFDKRGTGLSDRLPTDHLPGFDQRMDDLRAVMDAANCKDAFIFGVSEGGPLSIAFAATYPERCKGLIIFNSYARWISDKTYPIGWTREKHERSIAAIQANWGKPVGLKLFAPSVADDAKVQEMWASYMRNSASPGSALALYRMNLEIDVRTILPKVKTPTLVLHRAGDRMIEAGHGRYIAQHIPKAKYVELPGADHLAWFGEAQPVAEAIKNFMAKTPVQPIQVNPVNALAVFALPEKTDPHEVEASLNSSGALAFGKAANSYFALFKTAEKALRWSCMRQASKEGASFPAIVHLVNIGAQELRQATTAAKPLVKLLQPGKTLCTQQVKDLLINPEFKTDEQPADKKLGGIYEVKLAGILQQQAPTLNNQDVETFLKIRQYLNEHFREPVTLRDLAKKFGVNEFKLKTAFRQLFQNSIGKYLDERKMRFACELLETTDTAITDVAFQVGYEHYNNFILAFKKRYQMTPLQYRKKKQIAFQGV